MKHVQTRAVRDVYLLQKKENHRGEEGKRYCIKGTPHTKFQNLFPPIRDVEGVNQIFPLPFLSSAHAISGAQSNVFKVLF